MTPTNPIQHLREDKYKDLVKTAKHLALYGNENKEIMELPKWIRGKLARGGVDELIKLKELTDIAGSTKVLLMIRNIGEVICEYIQDEIDNGLFEGME